MLEVPGTLPVACEHVREELMHQVWQQLQQHILGTRCAETVILCLTLAAGLFIELDFAIYVGVISSLCVFIYDSATPQIPIIAPIQQGNGQRKFRDIGVCVSTDLLDLAREARVVPSAGSAAIGRGGGLRTDSH